MREDLIDFPCSPEVLDCYYERGLTPRHSEKYYKGFKEAAKELHRDTFKLQANTLNQQNRKIQELTDTNIKLQNKLSRIEKKLFGSSSEGGGQWQLKSTE